LRKNKEVRELLEEAIRDEMIEETLSEALLEFAGGEDYVLDFEPAKPYNDYVVRRFFIPLIR